MQLDQEASNLKDQSEQLSFRYTINNGTHTPPQLSQSSLCDHHRKKLSDLFLIRHLTGNLFFEQKAESSGELCNFFVCFVFKQMKIEMKMTVILVMTKPTL